ncbi:hypothetical protein ACWCYY_06705 [Kitasatospora sp. NPDC001664]
MSTHPPYTGMDPRHFGTPLGSEDLEPLLAEPALPDPGGTVLDLLRDAASEGAGRPRPNRTPGRRARLDGYC